MGMIPTYEQLGSLSDQDLVDRYDAAAPHTVVGTGFYLDELNRRRSLPWLQGGRATGRA
jgi:hypothetical protein